MDASHPAGLVQMREGPLRQFTAQLLQPLVAVSSHTSPILICPLLLFRLPLALPVPPSPLRLGDVTSDFLLMYVLQHGAAVIALVRYHLLHSPLIDFACRGLR